MFLHKYEKVVQRVLRSWQLLWSCMPTQTFLLNNPLPFIHTYTRRQLHRNLSLHPIFLSPLFISGPFCTWQTAAGFEFCPHYSPSFLSFCFAFTCWHTHTHRHTHTDTDRHRQTHTQTQLLSKAMRQLGWWIVYYKVAGIERPEYGSICMSVYEFHLSVSSFWSLLGNVNGVVNKLFFFHLILSIAKQITSEILGALLLSHSCIKWKYN